MPTSLRPYTESFEPEVAGAITRLIETLKEIGKLPLGYRLYTSEIQSCLSVGLLLAAVSVSSSLLELFVRDMTVAFRIASRHGGNLQMRAQVESSLEAERQTGFSAMLQELRVIVIEAADVDALRRFYESTRTPFARALVRRLTATDNADGYLSEVFAQAARRSGLEDRLENQAISEVEFVLQMVTKYLPWLLRRYTVAQTE